MERPRIFRAAGTVGGMVGGSRLLGAARDVLMAALFGTGPVMSAFAVAFTIPNLFRRLFGEGALSSSLVPVFMRIREQEGDGPAWTLANRILTFAFVLLSGLCVAGMAGLAVALARLDPVGYPAQIARLTFWLLPYMVFICLAALAMGLLNSFHRFALPAAAPWILNLCWIAAAALVAPALGGGPERQIYAVVGGILIAGLLQFGIQVPALLRLGWRPRPDVRWRDPAARRVLGLALPAAVGLGVTQINVLIDRLLAAWIGPWAAAALYFSERLVYLPLGLFATALSIVLLPAYAGRAARRERDRIPADLAHALTGLLFVMIPAAAGLLVLARPIVSTIFEWRAFDGASTEATAIALAFFAPGLVVFSLPKVLVPVFYALEDTRTPVRIGLASVGLNLVLNLVFVLTFPRPLKHAGLVLGTVLAEAAQGAALAVAAHRRLGSPGWARIVVSVLRTSAATLAMVAVVVLGYRGLTVLLAERMAAKPALALSTLGAIALGMAAYAGAAWILRSPELRDLVRALRRRPGRPATAPF